MVLLRRYSWVRIPIPDTFLLVNFYYSYYYSYSWQEIAAELTATITGEIYGCRKKIGNSTIIRSYL